MSIKKDLDFWEENEKIVLDYFMESWFNIEKNWKTDIIDFSITKDWNKVNLELKTRRVSSDKYEDTVIGANKVAEAYKNFYSDWEETFFLFAFTDWLYYLNPLDIIPRREFKKLRWDRGDIDKPKGWLYYKITLLKKIY
jgi:hypothetical protein